MNEPIFSGGSREEGTMGMRSPVHFFCHFHAVFGENYANPSGLTSFLEGDVVDVYLAEIYDNTSLYMSSLPYNTFTGFRIAPE